jgi:aminoglycoside phosphotransferase (APT) family kinase protein
MATITNDYLDESNKKRLQDIHSKRTSSSETIKAIMQQAIGKEAASYDRIVAGEVNEVYMLHFQNGDDVVLRIGHNKDRTFEAETWAIEQAGKAGVPVAKVLAIGTITSDGKELNYSVQEKITGIRFDTLLWTDQIETGRAQKITEQAGEILAKIHSVKTSGYGGINEHGQGPFPAAQSWVQFHIDLQTTYERLFRHHKMNSSTYDEVIAKLQTATQLFTQHPHLLHIDYGPKHILVGDHDEITGIIDFERAESGDSAMDFASWHFWFDKVVPTQWLYNGYERVSSLGEDFESRLQLAKLHELLHLLRYYTDVSPAPDAAASAARDITHIIVSRPL